MNMSPCTRVHGAKLSVSCKRVHLLDRDADGDPDNVASCKRGTVEPFLRSHPDNPSGKATGQCKSKQTCIDFYP